MNVYVVAGYSAESSWVSKVFDNEKSAEKYAEYMTLTNTMDYSYCLQKYEVESSFDLDINEHEDCFTTRLDKEDNYFEIYCHGEADDKDIEETAEVYHITVKIKYKEYKDEDERDKIIEERARKMLEEYLNEKN